MSYTQSEIVTATHDITETIYIFSSATDSTYANDPYCRVLDLNGNWVYRDASTTIYAYVLSGGTICSGIIEYPGRLYASAGATVTDMTIDGHTYICDPRAATGVARDDITLNNIRVAGNVEFVLRGSNVKAYDVFVQKGSKTAIQNGAYVEGLHIISGATATMEFNTGTVVDSNATTMTGSNFNVSAGSLVVNGTGKTLTISGLNVLAGATATLTSAQTYLENGNVVNGAQVYGGNLYVGEGAQVSGGLVSGHKYFNVSNGALINSVTISGGTANIYTGGSMTNIDLNGLAFIHGYASNIVQSGGSVQTYAGADVRDFTQTGGKLIVYDGGQVSGADIGASAVIYDNSLLSGATIRSGASAAISQGGLLRGATLMDGASVTVSTTAAVFKDAVVNAGAAVTVSNGATIENVDFRGTGQTLLATLSAGATGSDLRLSAGRINNYGIVKGLTIYGGYNYTYTGSISGLAVSGGSATIQRTAAVNDDITVETGALLNIYNAEITNLTQNGGTVSAVSAANFASPKITGATIAGGTALLTTGVSGAEFAMGGGELHIHAGANVSGATLTGGLTRVSGALLDADLRGVGKTDIASVFAGGTGENLRLSAGRFENRGAVNGLTIYDGYNYDYAGSISGLVISGGTATIQLTNAVNDDITVNDGGLLNIYNATVTNLTQNGGTILAVSAAAAATRISGAVINGGTATLTTGVSGADIRINDGRATMNGSFTGLDIGGGIADLKEGAVGGEVVVSGGTFYLSAGATGSGVTVSGGSAYARGAAAVLADVTQQGGRIDVLYGASGSNIDVSGGSAYFYQATVDGIAVRDGGSTTIQATDAAGLTVYGGLANIYTDIADIAQAGGSVYIANGATVTGLNATGGRVSIANGGVLSAKAGNTVNNLYTIAGAKIDLVKGAMLTGENTGIAEGTLYFNNTAVAGHAANGVLEGLAIGNAQFSIGDGIVAKGAALNNGSARLSAFAGANVSGATVTAGAIICAAAAAGSLDDVTINGATGQMNLSGTAQANRTVVSEGVLYVNNGGNTANNTTIFSGAKLVINYSAAKAIDANGAKIENTTIKAGGRLAFATGITSVDTGKLLTLDFTGATTSALTIDDLGLINTSTEIVLKGETAGNTYTIATSGSTEKYVNCGEWGLYDDSIKANESITNAFTGMTYTFNATGTAITVDSFNAGQMATAGSIDAGTTINSNGKAAKWTSDTSVTSGATFKAANSAIAGDAWLEIDGANLAGTTLFGADSTFAGGTVNIYATGDAVIGNLAAGATSSGTVGAVKFTVDDATVGLAYAGGFGNVTGATETLIGTGATIQKDFYAGALANYAKTNTATSAGNIVLDIEAGTFSGNIYGAASVKAGGATSVVHSAGNVTINVTGGETTKGNQACLFAGGYATGTTTNKVYTVGTISTTISGGSWGTAAGGRGIFGGIFANQVTAEAGDVSITIDGGSFGNVYGGGWAQKGGASIVRKVNISIAGGTITNVFGGGTTSTSGGSTTAGAVTITVSGGNITGSIYARGQGQYDSTGAAGVIFTGAGNFTCGVYGYSRVPQTDEYSETVTGAALSFNDYTGTFGGKIGGFDGGITLNGATAMTLTTAAADVFNGAWEFDLTGRDASLSDASLLTWSGADFAGDTVKVTFADETQAKAGWNIADAAFTGATFDLYVGSSEIATNINYDTEISGGAYDGWKFTDVDGTLKFAKLA